MTTTTNFTVPSVKEISQAIQSGKQNYKFIQQFGGCGRAYVCIGYYGDLFASDEQKKEDKATTRKIRNAVKKSAEQLGMIFQTKAYGVGGYALYIGYDNANSIAWSQAEQIAANLKALGIPAYADGQGD